MQVIVQCTVQEEISVSGEGQTKAGAGSSGEKAAPITIKKYANRRLYNTATSSYVTLDTLSLMVKSGEDFLVYDAKSGEDITRSVLTQIIFEEEAKGENLLPINFLRQLIGFYGNSMQSFVPGYLEMSLESLSSNQEKFTRTFGGEAAVEAMRTMTAKNTEMFQNAMQMFTPFGGIPGVPGQTSEAKPAESPKPKSAPNEQTGEIQALQDQISQLQDAINAMAKKG